ncbi:MAG: TRAP transporter substrate-binding protein [Proteobacteria bacterium]|nr:TRAP transporter substrate-binding protein [Pseudomonadota bacterium]
MHQKNDATGAPTRRRLIAATAALPLVTVLTRPARAAEFNYKLATGQAPSHPVNLRAQQAIGQIQEETHGKLEIKLFPSNQLGSDTDLLTQVRIGGVQFFNLATSILATLVPASGLGNVGFAFADYPAVWKAMDGALGDYIRAGIVKAGLIPVSNIWDNGFRQITSSTRKISTPEDLHGFKIRVPPAPILTSLFESLGAAATPINFNELYSALQTKLVEGQENPLPIIATTKLYEVQKYLSMTSHVWDGYQILGNRRAWHALPEETRGIVSKAFAKAGLAERADVAQLSQTLEQQLAGKGLEVVPVDRANFRTALQKTNFYQTWKMKFGTQGWSLLEDSVGRLT